MTRIEVDSTGLVFRNTAPHLRSLVAYHPSLVLGARDEMIVTFDTGQAVESLDYHSVLTRSRDGGSTWIFEGSVLKSPPGRTSHTLRINRMSDGTLVGIVAIFQRHDPEAGLVNRTTFGFVPMNLALIRSFDEGKSWTEFEPLTPPLVGPSWDICHPILELRSGRWLLPTATWRGWNGENPSGEQTVAFISDDRGRTWPKFGRIFDGRKIERSRLEVSLVELLDERVLAVAWVHDAQHCKNYPTEYAISDDNAETFSDPQQTGFEAETCKMLVLRDGRIFCAYRRTDKPGLWGCVATMRGSGWINSGEAPLWQGAGTVTTSEKNSADGLSALKFGYPSLGQLQDGKVLVVFWCQEACITNIRWLKIAVW